MEEKHIWESGGGSTPAPASHLGRVMNLIFHSRPSHLQASISRLHSSSRTTSVLLDDSLHYTQTYVRNAIENREPLDQILIPMIENSLKGLKHRKQALLLLIWLLEDDLVFQDLSSTLAEIITRKEDHYIALGWCTLVRGLVDHLLTTDQPGNEEKWNTLLKIFCKSISHLVSIICEGSIMQDGFELPTRVSVAAADCTFALTEALTRKAPRSEVSNDGTKSSVSNATKKLVTVVPTDKKEKKRSLTSGSSKGPEDMKMELVFWDHLSELVILLQKLQAWSRKSRPLHAKGLEQVVKWLQNIHKQYGSHKDEEGETLKMGILLLTSCWKHYVMLLRLEDPRFSQNYQELLDHYTSAMQFYSEDNTDEHPGKTSTGMETRKFFLNCISLLVGRLDIKQFENVISESGLHISNLLLAQLQCTDEEVIDGAVSILKTLISRTSFSTRSGPLDFHQMEAVFQSLLNLLDERDSTARAVVLLVAELYFLNPDRHCLPEIFKRLDYGNYCQKRNAIDVILELIHLSSDSGYILSPKVREEITEHMLQHLGDEEPEIQLGASNILSQIDPPLVLPALVQLVYSLDERVRSSASDTIFAMLKSHRQNVDLIIMLLDCLSKLCQGSDPAKSPGEIGVPCNSVMLQTGLKVDADQVLQLILKWAETVNDWSIIVEPLIDKMFADPSNSIIVRFLSSISEQLADSGDVVFRRVLLHTQGQKELDQSWLLKSENVTFSSDSSLSLKSSLFDRLCPLLVIRLLPLRVFNDLNSSVVYGWLGNEDILQDNGDASTTNRDSIASLVINRAFHLFEFEDVRKLAAELCGRLHPQVLFPIIESQLENATHCRDILKLKACLFTVCTSLVVRGKDSAFHPVLIKIRKTLEIVLLWPSADGDEVSKAQHGCIDCLALMICAELQAQESSNVHMNKIGLVEDTTSLSSVLTYVIQRLVCDGPVSGSTYGNSQSADKSGSATLLIECQSGPSLPLSFRLCMANVLISTCQKISSSAKHLLARRMLPAFIHSVELQVLSDSEIRAACLQVLFSAVYHLKSAILPYSSNLLKLSVKSLRKGSEKEQVAGAKLMASLMASEDEVVENLSSGLLKAKSVLASVSSATSSPELQNLCVKLLSCITSPLDDILLHLSTN